MRYGMKRKKSVYVWLGLFLLLLLSLACAGRRSAAERCAVLAVQQTGNAAFEGACGICAQARVSGSWLGDPELLIFVSNEAGKEIAEIQFYVLPCDQCGNRLGDWMQCTTKAAIHAGDSERLVYRFMDRKTKSADVYIYSVRFSDGTQWGDRNAEKETILNYAARMQAG